MIPEIDGIEPAARTLRQALSLEITFEQLRSEASAAFPDVVSQQEQQSAMTILQAP